MSIIRAIGVGNDQYHKEYQRWIEQKVEGGIGQTQKEGGWN